MHRGATTTLFSPAALGPPPKIVVRIKALVVLSRAGAHQHRSLDSVGRSVRAAASTDGSCLGISPRKIAKYPNHHETITIHSLSRNHFKHILLRGVAFSDEMATSQGTG